MTIDNYANEMEFASSSLINSIWDSFRRAEQLKKEIAIESARVQQEYNRSIAMQHYAEDPDDVMLGVGRYWENYFGADKELYHKNVEFVDLTQLLAARELSIATLSGNLLEHVKKGLSLIYGGPRNWPIGRMVGSQALSKVVLEARNQSAHYDEAKRRGSFSKADVGDCFTLLEKEFDPIFADYLKRDMSFDVIKVLEWTTYAKFKADLILLK
ncbi:MAG: hypothetical protein EOP04_02440 [Proteobacteria bacterium]|nr:MAG: hypothetical protein EOP04_02440 [Pseudomonadota bacterium]